jgi:hypothetical protein
MPSSPAGVPLDRAGMMDADLLLFTAIGFGSGLARPASRFLSSLSL